MSGASMIQGEDGAWREPVGHALLWGQFGCSRASWLALPRVMMHEMPDRWQARMASLIHQFHQHFDWPEDLGEVHVTCRINGKIAKLPDWLAYKYPDVEKINSFRAQPTDQRAGE